MHKSAWLFAACHHRIVGSVLVRRLNDKGFTAFVTAPGPRSIYLQLDRVIDALRHFHATA